jgi:hypothetical protein
MPASERVFYFASGGNQLRQQSDVRSDAPRFIGLVIPAFSSKTKLQLLRTR